MPNALNLLAPKYLAPAEWGTASIDLGEGRPLIKRTGTWVTSQAMLDDLVTQAIATDSAVVYLDLPPMGYEDPRLENPNAYYPTPALLAEMIARAEEVAGAAIPGPPGPPGADGADGADGTNGTNGTNGLDGATVVHHGTNGAVARPSTPLVYWVGTATPANALAWDFWLQENV